jgi:hypothetical protein
VAIGLRLREAHRVPAIRWPRGSELMPARTCSATRTGREDAQAQHGGDEGAPRRRHLLDRVAHPLGQQLGNTKNHRNICTMSGMLRKIST